MQNYLIQMGGYSPDDHNAYEFHDGRITRFDADTLADFISMLDEHVVGFTDENYDHFWGGDTYIHLWSSKGFTEVSPADFLVGAYIATDIAGLPEFDMIYGKWVTPGAMGLHLGNEDESVTEVYEFIREISNA